MPLPPQPAVIHLSNRRPPPPLPSSLPPRAAGRGEAAGVPLPAAGRRRGLRGQGPAAEGRPSPFPGVALRASGGPRRPEPEECLPAAAPPSRSSFLRAGARRRLPSPPRRARGEAARPASSCGQRARRSRPPRRTGPWRGREEEAAPCPPLPSSLPSPPVLAAAPPPACDPLPHVSGEEGRRGAGPSVAAAAAAGGGRGGAGAAARRPPAASPLGPAGAPSPPALPMPVWCCRCSLAGHFR